MSRSPSTPVTLLLQGLHQLLAEQARLEFGEGPAPEHPQTQQASQDPEVPTSKHHLWGAGLPMRATRQITASCAGPGCTITLAADGHEGLSWLPSWVSSAGSDQ